MGPNKLFYYLLGNKLPGLVTFHVLLICVLLKQVQEVSQKYLGVVLDHSRPIPAYSGPMLGNVGSKSPKQELQYKSIGKSISKPF